MRVIKLALLFLSGFILASCGTDSSPTLYDVQVSVSPSEGGTIAPTADSTLEAGQQITLSAQSAEGYRFVNWTGDIDSTANPLSITIGQDYSLMANFEKKSYELTVNTDGDGMVSEQIIPTTSTAYEHGTVVELTANPAEGWEFVEWLGDLSGSNNPEQITVDKPKEVTAVFEQVHTLTINTSGEGTVTTEPDRTEFAEGKTVTLTANPADGWIFDQWVGAEPATENPIDITITEDTEVTALFEESNPFDDGIYAIDITIQGEGEVEENLYRGEVIGDGYSYSADVYLTAKSAEGWIFERWEGDLAYYDDVNPILIDVESDIKAVAVMVRSPFAGGSGTEDNPYQIETLAQLQAIKDYEGHFIQIANIDASPTENWNNGKGFEPIGAASYDGQGHEILNIFMDRRGRRVAIFSEGSRINNLHLTGIDITGGPDPADDHEGFVGGLVARGGELSNIEISGTVSAVMSEGSGNKSPYDYAAGGVVGSCFCEMNEVHADVDVKAPNYDHVGGLIGALTFSGDITNSSTGGDVSGNSEVGGLIGFTDYCPVTRSNATGNVTGTEDVGGLIGRLTGGLRLEESYATGKVSGTRDVGGLVGQTGGRMPIENSYARGEVQGETNVGGLIGMALWEVRASYSTGSVTGTTAVGGLFGKIDIPSYAKMVANYWDIETSGQNNGSGSGEVDGYTGLTTSEMTGNAAKDNMPGFVFGEVWETTDSYPILRWQE